MTTSDIRAILRITSALLMSLAGLTHSGVARADWGAEGAQYNCSPRNGLFEILPHDRSSDDPYPSVKSGFLALPEGQSNLRCRIGGRLLQAQISVYPPAERGMCMGGGYVSVESLSVNGVELVDSPTAFDWDCPGVQKVVNRIVVSSKKLGIEFKVCSIPPQPSGDAPVNPICTAKQIDVDAIAMVNAQIDHQLADPQTQIAQSATKLPPEYDLAKVFGLDGVPGSSLPMCTHWSSLFSGSPEEQRHGYIAGTVGERVYLHATNPQLCSSQEGDGCNSTAYLLPGDRVFVGSVCGDWIQVKYQPRIRSKPSTIGWVQTARVYAVGPLNDASTYKKSAYRDSGLPSDPFLRAVVTKDIGEMRRLVANGTSPDGEKRSGVPLSAAINTGEEEVVQAILDLGAQVNPSRSRPFDACSFLVIASLRQESPRLFELLLKRGLNVNCREPHFGGTALMEVAGEKRLWRWEWMHRPQSPMSDRLTDPKQMVRRLMAAGADMHAIDGFGRTALFYAVEANNIDVAWILLKAGANPNVTTPDKESHARQRGGTPLMAALWEYQNTRDPTMIRILLEHGADPNYRNSSDYDAEWDETTSGAVTFAGQTLLTRAAQDGHYGLVKLLLERGANAAIPRQDGKLAEEIAENKGHAKIAELLRKARR